MHVFPLKCFNKTTKRFHLKLQIWLSLKNFSSEKMYNWNNKHHRPFNFWRKRKEKFDKIKKRNWKTFFQGIASCIIATRNLNIQPLIYSIFCCFFFVWIFNRWWFSLSLNEQNLSRWIIKRFFIEKSLLLVSISTWKKIFFNSKKCWLNKVQRLRSNWPLLSLFGSFKAIPFLLLREFKVVLSRDQFPSNADDNTKYFLWNNAAFKPKSLLCLFMM